MTFLTYNLSGYWNKDLTCEFFHVFLVIIFDLALYLSHIIIAAIFSAVEDDANRAIELKNGASVGGRKIAVKHAMPRPPREARQSKSKQGWCYPLILVQHTAIFLIYDL